MRTIAQSAHIKTCEIRTTRHVGHWNMLWFLTENNFFSDEMFPNFAKALSSSIPFAEKDIAFLEIRLFKEGRKAGVIEWMEHGDQKNMTAMQCATAKSAAIVITLALEYASHTPLAGFIMPESFTSKVLNLQPKNIIDKMKEVGLSITTSLP